MAKAKGLKLGKLSFLNSFGQLCRPNNPSSMIKTTTTNSTYILSPLNSKSFDISFPGFPSPPPSTPTNIFPSKSCKLQNNHLSKPTKNKAKLCNEITDRPIIAQATSRFANKKHYKKSSVSSFDSEETDSLFSSPPSFSSSHDFNHPLKTIHEEEWKPVKQRSVRGRRFKRYGSKEWKEDVVERTQNSSETGESSFVVVKRSVDPYEDFKKSMCEMIIEKQMFEPNELEQLLMSFLSLNSRLHHKVIIEAFTQILKELFSWSNQEIKWIFFYYLINLWVVDMNN